MTKPKQTTKPDAEKKQREKQEADLIPFTKGDPRINRKGRPKNFDALRKLAQEIAGEELANSGLTRIHAMLLAMSTSKNPRDRQLFLEYAFGKVKDEVELTGANGGALKIEAYDYNSAIADLAPLPPRPVADSDPPGENESDSDGQAVGQDADGG